MKEKEYKRRENTPDEYRSWLPPEDALPAETADENALSGLPKEVAPLPNPDVRRDEFNHVNARQAEKEAADAYALARQKKRKKRLRRAFYTAFSAAFVWAGMINADSSLFSYFGVDTSALVSPTEPVGPGETSEQKPGDTDSGTEVAQADPTMAGTTEEATEGTTAEAPKKKFVLHPNYGPYDAVGMMSVYDGAIDFENDFSERRLSFLPYDEGSFTGRDLPEATQQEDFTNIGYILICDLNRVSEDADWYEPTATWMLSGDYLTPEDLRHVKFSLRDDIQIRMVRFDPEHKSMQMVVGMHANGGNFDASEYPLFPDIEEDYCEIWTGTPLYSEGWAYLDAYPIPKREGYTFTGWYSSQEAAEADPFSEEATQGRLCVLNPHDFYEADPDSAEGINWTKPVTYHVYAGWQKD
ncbi:MAG: hypothetical protein IK125_02285 [Lachnospiraceae bacterium]|nr:hypothetical protein [Lachnospiraceae bacterium]